MQGLNLRNFPIYSFIIISSLLFSLWSAINGSVINTDGVCYLKSAESFSQGLNAAMHACPQAKWPFYSILIAGLAYISDLSYLTAAYVLNGFFSILTAIVFVKIIEWIYQSYSNAFEFTHSQRSLLWFAAIIILLSNEFNSVKYYIIRDHGFWAFYLLSFYYLLQFFHNQRVIYSIAWSTSLLIATLFRIEGGIFLILLPFLAFFNSELSFRARVKSFFKMNILLALVGVVLVVWVCVASPSNLGRLSELSYQVTHGFSQLVTDYQLRANHLSEYVLSHFAARYAAWILLITLIIWYIISAIKNISFIYSILALYAWSKKILKIPHSANLVLWGYLFINVFVTAMFLAEHMFLSKRYLIALSLIVMIWVPFALQQLSHKWQYQQWRIFSILLLMVASSIGGVFEFGHSKKYIREAGDWLADHTPSDAKIISNDILVMYYSKRFGNEIFAFEKKYKNVNFYKTETLKQYQYIALRINKNALSRDTPILEGMNNQPIQIFSNKRGDQVRIYKS